jgi:hypothetical protein
MEYFGKPIHKISKTETLYKANSKDIINVISKWKDNRPVDNKRVREIAKSIKQQDLVDGIIYIARIKRNKKYEYECYDGFHRFSALKLLKNNYNVLINILQANNDNVIREKFKLLNKMMLVSDLYLEELEENDGNYQETIELTCDYILAIWDDHCKTSNQPQRPHFNIDGLKNTLLEVLKNCDVKLNSDTLFSNIEELNEKYRIKYKDSNLFSKNILEKCNKTGCYLFLTEFTNDLIREINDSQQIEV